MRHRDFPEKLFRSETNAAIAASDAPTAAPAADKGSLCFSDKSTTKNWLKLLT